MAGFDAVKYEIECYFRDRGSQAQLSPVPGGTLGLCFRLEIDGCRRFLKTHLEEDWCRANLAKEASLLAHLYGNAINLETFRIEGAMATRLCLVMDELEYPARPYSPEEVRAIVEFYSSRLEPRGFHLDDRERDFSYLVEQALQALQQLFEDGYVIDPGIRRAVHSQFELLQRKRHLLIPAICHGDLGPKNIMTNGGGPIVIDWEDAFVGVADYDYLYWLTFIENRRFYSSSAIGTTRYGKDLEVAILLLVVTLKSLLSVRAGTQVGHSISIQDRLLELLKLSSQ
jgi:fructosamine-3-kinase